MKYESNQSCYNCIYNRNLGVDLNLCCFFEGEYFNTKVKDEFYCDEWESKKQSVNNNSIEHKVDFNSVTF